MDGPQNIDVDTTRHHESSDFIVSAPTFRRRTRIESYSLNDGGLISVEWPEKIGAEDLNEIEKWVRLVLKKMRRCTNAES
jgi:hypothetical protein